MAKSHIATYKFGILNFNQPSHYLLWNI